MSVPETTAPSVPPLSTEPTSLVQLIYRIVDSPSRTACAVAVSAPLVGLFAQLTQGGALLGSTLGTGAGIGAVSGVVALVAKWRTSRGSGNDAGASRTPGTESGADRA